MTWPVSTPKPVIVTESPETDVDIVKNTESLNDETSSDRINNIKSTVETIALKQSLKTTSFRYKNTVAIIGLTAGLTAMIIGYVFYRRSTWRRKMSASESPGNVAVIMNDLSRDFYL